MATTSPKPDANVHPFTKAAKPAKSPKKPTLNVARFTTDTNEVERGGNNNFIGNKDHRHHEALIKAATPILALMDGLGLHVEDGTTSESFPGCVFHESAVIKHGNERYKLGLMHNTTKHVLQFVILHQPDTKGAVKPQILISIDAINGCKYEMWRLINGENNTTECVRNITHVPLWSPSSERGFQRLLQGMPKLNKALQDKYNEGKSTVTRLTGEPVTYPIPAGNTLLRQLSPEEKSELLARFAGLAPANMGHDASAPAATAPAPAGT